MYMYMYMYVYMYMEIVILYDVMPQPLVLSVVSLSARRAYTMQFSALPVCDHRWIRKMSLSFG